MLQVRPDLDVDTARDRLARLLRRQAQRFDRLGRRTYRQLDATGVHDLRVLVRRIRAAVWVAGQLTSRASLRALRRSLRRLGRALGGRRMLDVMSEDAARYGLDGSALGGRLAEAGQGVSKLLRPARRAALVAMMRAAEGLLDRATGGRLAEGLAQKVRRLGAACERAPEGKREMHALRIELKKARYVLESLGRRSEFIKPLQTRLGRSHDLEVLQETLGQSEKAARDERRERAAARRMMKRIVATAVRELGS